jgi:hypothetical protein
MLSQRLSRAGARAALLAGGLSGVAWLWLLTCFKPGWIADEQRHFLVILSYSRGEQVPAGFLPMLPTFHLILSRVVSVFGRSLLTVRVFNLVCFVVGLVLVAAICRRRGDASCGTRVLLFAWNPLLFPYACLAYTEMPTVAAILAAAYLHETRRPRWSGLALALACLLRQSSVVWVAFFALREVQRICAQPDGGGRGVGAGGAGQTFGVLLRRAGSRVCVHALVLLSAGLLLAVNPSFARGLAHANRVGLNPAQLYLFGLVLALCWAPVWMSRLWLADVGAKLQWGRFCALVLAGIGIAELAYANPHPWNADPNYLRNRVLVWLSLSRMGRLALGGLLALVGMALTEFWRGQSRRLELGLTGIFGLLYVLPHYLVDPRYYIVPAVMLNLYASYREAELRRLGAWYLLLSAGACGYILLCGGPDGGVP